ncbi:MAG TPA: molybdopterin-synthase adenylyltransferase MoeB [Nitrososphaerales archaeon]|nr:molybdopterin-synthase adenylyltransferase MoeB [Nitrososphaerales archaeon]
MPEYPTKHDLTQSEVERYSRQMVLPELGPRGQQKLKESSVLVIGAGGLGTPASVYLAAAGVGRIGVVDEDVVEKSNLHRQTIYTEEDIGKLKAVVAAERLQSVNPHIKVEPHKVRLSSANALDIMRDYDVVIDCTDNFPARYLINDACVLLGKPDVYASIFRFDGQASTFHSRKGPCYRCLFPEPPPPDNVQDCAVAGVLGVLPGIMGSIQAIESIKLMIGMGDPLFGRLLVFNATDMTFNELRFKKNPDCPVCGEQPTVRSLIDYEEFCGVRRAAPSVQEVAPMELKREIDVGDRIVLLDVREPFEYALCRIENAKLIPLGELGRRVNELDRSAKTVVYCHTGVRSARAVELLTSEGFHSVRNLKGGIRAWAEEVDRKVPIY